MDEYLSTKIRHLSLVSVLLVVFVHTFNIQPDESHATAVMLLQHFISNGIARVGVPFFFFFSGVLFFRNFNFTAEGILLKYRKRLHTLFIPYILWWGWCLLLALIAKLMLNTFTPGSEEQLMQRSTIELLWRNPFAYHLWFLRDLMVLVLFAPILFRLIQLLNVWLLPAAAIYWILNITYPFAGQALFFFTIGALIQLKHPSILLVRFTHYPIKIFGILWMMLLGLNTYLLWQGSVAMYVMNTVHALTVLVGMISIWMWYDKRTHQHQHLSKVWSKSAFFIYVAHEPILSVIKKLLLTVAGNGDAVLCAVYFLAPIVTIALLFYIKVFIQRISPKLYTLITGGR